MSRSARLGACLSALLLFAAALPILSAAPVVTNVQNAASNTPQGLPNAALAQGSVFVVKGSGLGPASISVAPVAFQSTTVSGTSVAVTVGSTTVNAPMYYTSDAQVAALLPSSVPTGNGTITVTYNGQTSAPAPVGVTLNNLAILTIDSSGGGPAIVTFPDYSLVSTAKTSGCGGVFTACGAANPGDTLTLWGTGLGPVTGNDVSGAGLGQNMPNIPLTVWLGGVRAPVVYQGRSGCCVGEDQIVFTVPADTPTGCAVPLAVQIGGRVSNTTALPVADGSRNCLPTYPPYDSVSLEQAILTGTFTSGAITLNHSTRGGGAFEDDVKFEFFKLTANPGMPPYLPSWFDVTPLGTCIVYNNLDTNLNLPISGALLDAGASFTVTGPNGSLAAPSNFGNFSKINAAGTFLVPGAYTVSGTGGADVGPFTANISISPSLTLASPADGATVTRSNGLTVNWTGGTGYVQIQVNAPTNNTFTTGAAAVCLAAASTGTLTIPPYVLEALPATNLAGLVLSSVTVNTFSATGLTVGAVQTLVDEAGFGYGWRSGSLKLQ